MIKPLLLSLILFFSVSMPASPYLFIKGYSFAGSYYYPDRDDKEFSYFDKHDIRFGLENLQKNQFSMKFTLRTEEELQNQTLFLQELDLRYQKSDNLSAGFMINDIGFGGSRHKLLQPDVTEPYYGENRLAHYRFHGLSLYYRFSPHLSSSSYLGGNPVNTSIAASSLEWSLTPVEFKTFYLHTGRDKNFNKSMHSAGTELLLPLNRFHFFHSYTYQHLKSVFTIRNHLSYHEVLFQVTPHLHTGGTHFYARRFRGHSSWRDYTLQAGYQREGFSKILRGNYQETSRLKARKISSIITYYPGESFSIGLNSALYLPRVKERYYSIGFQIGFNEKFAL